jgi:hypothetical protein
MLHQPSSMVQRTLTTSFPLWGAVVDARLYPHALAMWFLLTEADHLRKAFLKESRKLSRCGVYRSLMMGKDMTKSDLISSGKKAYLGGEG